MSSYAATIARKNFAKLADGHISALSGIVGGGANAIVGSTDASALESFNTDWLRHARGHSQLVVFPKSTKEVAELMRYCNKERIAVCPQGGNTGLVHGSVPVHDEVIISTSKMTNPMAVHKDTYSMVCGAGCVLQTLQEEAKANGFIFPLDLGAKGSCQIGGNISTNAGGIHYARYGSVRSNVLGLEAVTATGEIISSMTRGQHGSDEYRAARKDNVGYDLKQLFIGTEGTLGIVTKAEMGLYARPATNNIMLLHVRTFSDVLQLFHRCKRSIGDLLSAFEVMDSTGLVGGFADKIAKSAGGKPSDLFYVGDVEKSSHLAPSFVVLLETQGFSAQHDEERLMEFLEGLSSGGASSDASSTLSADSFIDQVMATSEAQLRSIWNVREDLPVVLSSCGTILKYDVCFPFDGFYLPVDFARAAVVRDLLGGLNLADVLANPTANSGATARVEKLLGEELIVTGYGHFGDGNVHLNIVDRTPDRRHSAYLKNTLSPQIYKHVIEKGGSVSAEHGVGMQKRAYLAESRSPQWVGLMRAMKQQMDPNGILSPYKMFVE